MALIQAGAFRKERRGDLVLLVGTIQKKGASSGAAFRFVLLWSAVDHLRTYKRVVIRPEKVNPAPPARRRKPGGAKNMT